MSPVKASRNLQCKSAFLNYTILLFAYVIQLFQLMLLDESFKRTQQDCKVIWDFCDQSSPKISSMLPVVQWQSIWMSFVQECMWSPCRACKLEVRKTTSWKIWNMIFRTLEQELTTKNWQPNHDCHRQSSGGVSFIILFVGNSKLLTSFLQPWFNRDWFTITHTTLQPCCISLSWSDNLNWNSCTLNL